MDRAKVWKIEKKRELHLAIILSSGFLDYLIQFGEIKLVRIWESYGRILEQVREL